MTFKWTSVTRARAWTPCVVALACLAGCGGGSSADSSGSGVTQTDQTQQTGTVSMLVSDAPSDDWALVGVKIESIALVPQGGGANVTVYSVNAASAPYVNLVQLDQLSEILGNVVVPVGTYTGAVLTVGGNSGDVLLTTSSDPEAGFAGAASTAIASSAIQIQHTQDTSGNRTVPINVNFDSPLVVSASSSNALDLEFDLSHPAFIIAHQPPGAAALLWAVNFTGPVRRHPIADITQLVLRQHYGTVTAVASGSITINKDYPTYPIVNPETALETAQSLTINVDSTNGTLYYDVDSQSGPTKVMSFSDLTALTSGAYVRIQARYQEDGTLTATRVWASSSFNSVWVSPEGHVLDVGTSSVTVTSESGFPVTVDIGESTNFYFHGGTTAIGMGPTFLSSLVRGFKVHVYGDPLATPLTASEVDIESAEFSGKITGANSTDFSYTHDFVRSQDNYTEPLPYISSNTANITDGTASPIMGFLYWPFAYPTMITDGSTAIGDFVADASETQPAYGFTGAMWGDADAATGWYAPWVGLLPTPVPLATVTTGLTSGNSFTLTTVLTNEAYTADLSVATGEATLVYQVDRTNGIVTVSPVDITTSSGLATLTQALVMGAPVKVYGVPTGGSALMVYVLFYYTGDMPAS
ncbi:MAG TPA: DUF4382 domain-containing protein [Steroidobacteraceae bacterium]|nr:DUF4382 domain-containing protein [Steroidobacteraceae bacterium]